MIRKEEVMNYWDNSPCAFQFPDTTPEWFEREEELRYSDQPYIHSFVQFSRWCHRRILEIGVGVGVDFSQFARSGADAIGVDLSYHSIKIAKRRIDLENLSAHLVRADAETLPFISSNFDLIYSWGVIHHTPSPEKAVAEVYRCLKPGGSLRMMFYRRFSGMGLKLYLKYALFKGRPMIRLTKLFRECQESPGTKAYNVGELKKLFKSFEKIQFQYFPYDVLALRRRLGHFADLTVLFPRFLFSWIGVRGEKGLAPCAGTKECSTGF